MTIASLGLRTDLIFPRFDSEVTDRGEYLVIRTPANPGFFWGNCVIFDRPPATEDVTRWLHIFKNEIGEPPLVKHCALGWDDPHGESADVEAFVNLGFTLDECVVLATDSVLPLPHFNDEITVRPFESEDAWLQSLEIQVLSREPQYGESGYREFSIQKVRRYQKMAQAGLGAWHGAFIGDRLVGDLGLYFSGDVGRFQSVETHPDFRRRGICGTLVYEVATQALSTGDVNTLVMVADTHYHAARIYETLGFKLVERQRSLTYWKEE